MFLSVFTAVLQANDGNQWVKADLGAESLVCGVTTQGRGEFTLLVAKKQTRTLNFTRFLAIVLCAHHQPCL